MIQLSKSEGDEAGDAQIERYCRELAAEAELARGDLAEIEDHLRELAAELRERGVPPAEAIAQACRRLGDPRAIAREHARVRSPFGARISAARTWSAAALLGAPFVLWLARGAHLWSGWWSPYGLDTALMLVGLVALAARRTWARAVIFGSVAAALPSPLLALALGDLHGPGPLAFAAAHVGALVFLAPWRRRELTASGLALALLAFAYTPALSSHAVVLTAPTAVVLGNPLGTTALTACLLACGGILLRARWASLPAIVAAWALAMYGREVSDMTVRIAHPTVTHVAMLCSIFAGAACAALVALLAWRGGRGGLGTLRHVLD